MDIAELERFNPWWRTGQVREAWLKAFKRPLYAEIQPYLPARQALLIQGLRRVGKTTLLFQVIDSLLPQTKAKQILYFSFDEIAFSLKDVLETYQQQVLGQPFEALNEKIYIFFDEVQKVKDWENKIKVYYDLYPNIKFFISGSASLTLRRRSQESLAGRTFDFTLEPLTFEEFLELKGRDTTKIRENLELWPRELLPLFHQFIRWGNFPELIQENDEERARKYLLNNIIERIIYKDIPEEFLIKDLELLKNLVYFIGKSPGALINYKELAKNLGRDERTISNYFEYLEQALLIKFVFNYRGSPLASRRKLKKVYFTSPNLIFAFAASNENILPQQLENVIACKTKALFFYRNGYEVDFVIVENNHLLAIEVKSGNIALKQLKRFSQQFGSRVKKSIIVDLVREGKEEDIEIIPAWKFLLQKKAG